MAKIPLPNLDDRRWADLVDEGRSLIPVYAPDWTDHNIHDPGITLMELFAFITEADIYQLNRISDERKLKLLELVGIKPEGPRPARAVLSLTLKEGATPQRLPAATEFAGDDPFGQETRFRTLSTLNVIPGELAAIQIKDAKRFHNVTDRWRRLESFGAFGAIPEASSELYLGFTKALERNRWVSLYFKIAGSRADERERLRIIEETGAYRRACRPPASEITCEHKGAHVRRDADKKDSEKIPTYRARVVWEFLMEVDGKQTWQPLETERQVKEQTRSFTLDGSVAVKIPGAMTAYAIGEVEAKLYYLRCRFEAGAYDGPPVLQTVMMNAVEAEQSVPVTTTWTIRTNVNAEGPEPSTGDYTGLRLEFDERGQISRLVFVDDDWDMPRFRVLDYRRSSSSTKGLLIVEAVLVGYGNGRPLQNGALPASPVEESSFNLFTCEEGAWRTWTLRRDFDASTRSDLHFLLDAASGLVSFGDGRAGRVPPKGSLIFAAYRTTRAEDGNLAARTLGRLVDAPHNRAVMKNFESVRGQLQSITNPLAASGGAAAEPLGMTLNRAIGLMETTRRAVTLKDYEELAKGTPGVRLARVTARANLHPSFPCLKASGIVTLIILPDMPVARPVPGWGLRRAVASYLHYRRVIGTRVEVVGPTYLEVAVSAQVKALNGVGKTNIQQRVVDALKDFLDPLKGGPDKTGWPFGRDVYRSEIMQVIDEVAGVDHVISLNLLAEGCEPQCGNVCLGPTWLVASGNHEIEVL